MKTLQFNNNSNLQASVHNPPIFFNVPEVSRQHLLFISNAQLYICIYPDCKVTLHVEILEVSQTPLGHALLPPIALHFSGYINLLHPQ